MYTRSLSAALPSSAISSFTLAAAAVVKSIGRFGGGGPVSGRPTISMRSGWGAAGRGSSSGRGTARRIRPRERLFGHVAALGFGANRHPHRGESVRQHDVALHLLEVLERIRHRRCLVVLAQVGPLQLLESAVAGALDRHGHAALAGLAAVQVLGQHGGEMPHPAFAGPDLQFMHGQAAAFRGGTDEAFVEGDLGAQPGHLLLALGQRALQLAVGLAADLVRARQRGHPLLQRVHLLAQHLRVLAGPAAEYHPRAPGAEPQRQQDQGEQSVDPVEMEFARRGGRIRPGHRHRGRRIVWGRFPRLLVGVLAAAHPAHGIARRPGRHAPGRRHRQAAFRRLYSRQRPRAAATGGPVSEAHLFAIGVLLAWLAGIRAYLTVFGVGLAGALGWLDLPEALQVTTSPWVLGISGGLAVLEFFTDKVPDVDSAWDLLQTLARVPAGAFLAAAALSPDGELGAGMLATGAGVALSSHVLKAGSRAMLNVSPEPVSNWAASASEDVVVVGALALALAYPWLALALVLVIGACSALLVWWIWRRVFRRRPRPAAAPP